MMIPIAALLNVDSDDEEKASGVREMKTEPVASPPPRFLRQTSSATSVGCTSSDEREDDHPNSPEDDDDEIYERIDGQTYAHIKRELEERGSLTTNETSSLLGALTLQNLRYASTPTSAGEDNAAAEPAPPRAYLSMESLTNPVDENEVVGENNKPLTPSKAARAARRRSTRELFPGASDEDRRAKQRMIVKRCYYKKIHTINDLREQVQQLEGVLHSVLEEQEEQRGENQDGGEAAMQALVDQYVDTVKDKEVLRHENQRLRKLADEYYMKNQGRLRVLLDTNRKEMILFTPALSDE